MKGLLDWMMSATGTGPYAIENIKKRQTIRSATANTGKGRRLEDILDDPRPKIGMPPKKLK
jgi:hypothetical protein